MLPPQLEAITLPLFFVLVILPIMDEYAEMDGFWKKKFMRIL